MPQAVFESQDLPLSQTLKRTLQKLKAASTSRCSSTVSAARPRQQLRKRGHCAPDAAERRSCGVNQNAILGQDQSNAQKTNKNVFLKLDVLEGSSCGEGCRPRSQGFGLTHQLATTSGLLRPVPPRGARGGPHGPVT